MEEMWRDIPGYEGYYQVSNLGRVKSLERMVKHGGYEYRRKERIRSPFETAGYLCVALNKDTIEKTYQIHQLVAIAFIPNPENKPIVNHIDGNKTNNCVDNLEWVTYKENAQHAIRIGLLDPEQCRINGRKSIDVTAIRVLCEDTGELFESVIEAGRQLGIDCIPDNIHQHKRTHNGRGWLFRIVDEDYYQKHKNDSVDTSACESIHATIRKRVKQQGKATPIYCVERDITYPSRLAAAKDNNMNTETINLAIKENRKAKGLTFRYVEN